MSAAYKITARCYCITARANIAAVLVRRANAARLDEALARNLEELRYGG